MAQKLRFNKVTAYRDKLDSHQEKMIRQLYKDVAKDIQKELKALQGKSNYSSIMKRNYLTGMQKQINSILRSNGKALNKLIQDNMLSISSYTINAYKEWAISLGMKFGTQLFNIPKDIVNVVATGQLYEGNWSLSRSIWKDIDKKQSDINTIIAKGIAQNKSAYDIAKDLEMYVNPTAKKPWDWAKVYPGVHKQIDYNAQRLARTCVSHAYEEAFIRATEPNPFVLKYQWQASSAHPCPLCMDRNGEIYNKGSLPLDHPNGKCTFIAITEDEDKIIDSLAAWVNSPEGTFPEIDAFSKAL